MSTDNNKELIAELRKLSAYIENRGGIRVRVDRSGGCGPATAFECELWDALEAAERDAWLPIETAPKDGSAFLGISLTEIDTEGLPVMWSCRFDTYMEYFRSNWDHEPLYDLTHWRPLPAPPKKEE